MLDGKKRIFWLVIAGLVIAGWALFPSGVLAGTTTLKIGHVLAPKSNQNQALVKVFKPYVEKESGGSIKVEVFPNEQLGHGPEMVEGVKLGTQEMFLGSQTWFAAHIEEIGTATIPFLFDDRAHFQRWMTEILGKQLMPELINKANQRIINLSPSWERGPFRVICAKKPIFTPKDVEGLKLRLWPAKMIQKSWAGFGAKIHTIDFAEAYLALKQGVVEAITTPFDLIYPQKFNEVAPYITELRQFPQLELISINEKVWQNLTEDERRVLIDGAAEAGQWYNEQAKTRVEETVQELLKTNAYYILVNRQPFVDAFRNEVIPELIEDGLVEKEWIQKVESVK
jgi:tripartite ATP-independent transporter DctP family solute receptor